MPILKNKVRIYDLRLVEDNLKIKAKKNSSTIDTSVNIESNSQNFFPSEESSETEFKDISYEKDPGYMYSTIKLQADSNFATNPSHSINKPSVTPPHSPTTNTQAKIIRNYAQALCAFAYSKLSIPYLQHFLEQPPYVGKVKVQYFQRFIKSRKRYAHNIHELRNLLLVTPDDTEKEAIYKKLFADICEVFIKYFSVNWIFSGKVKLIDDHLKLRHKMLRRIRNPEHFTYLRTKVSLNK